MLFFKKKNFLVRYTHSSSNFGCFEINYSIFFNGVKASTVKKLKLGEKISVECKTKKIKSGDWNFTDYIFLKFKKIINKQNNNGKQKKNAENAQEKRTVDEI